MKFYTWIILATLLLLCQIANAQTDVPDQIKAPAKYEALLTQSRQLALDTIQTDQFENELVRFYEAYRLSGAIESWQNIANTKRARYDEMWAKLPIETIISDLRQTAPILGVSTFGGFKGWRLDLCCGTLALDGKSTGPMLLNRYALPRPKIQVAGTIVHEAAHRIGLSHVNYSKTPRLGKCEPPYVIGQLLQRQLEGDAWTYDGNDCELLESWEPVSELSP